MELVQSNMALAIAASAFLNAGLILASTTNIGGSTAVVANSMKFSTKCLLGIAGLLGIQVPIGIIKLKALDKKFKQFSSAS